MVANRHVTTDRMWAEESDGRPIFGDRLLRQRPASEHDCRDSYRFDQMALPAVDGKSRQSHDHSESEVRSLSIDAAGLPPTVVDHVVESTDRSLAPICQRHRPDVGKSRDPLRDLLTFVSQRNMDFATTSRHLAAPYFPADGNCPRAEPSRL